MAAPFARARAMFAAIKAALAIPQILAREAALGHVGQYRSRGKGRGAPTRRYGNACNNGGKGYPPHQGPQECAKRARNVARGLQSPGTIKLVHQRKEAA